MSGLEEKIRELSACLSKIQKTDTDEQQKLVILKFYLGRFLVVNLDFLRTHKALIGATVFNLLFQLNKDTPFSNEPMMIDNNGCITICESLQISIEEWLIFMKFLRFGEVENNADDRAKLDIISVKLGGIPSIDTYLKKYYEMEEFFSRSFNIKDRFDYTKSMQKLQSLHTSKMASELDGKLINFYDKQKNSANKKGKD